MRGPATTACGAAWRRPRVRAFAPSKPSTPLEDLDPSPVDCSQRFGAGVGRLETEGVRERPGQGLRDAIGRNGYVRLGRDRDELVLHPDVANAHARAPADAVAEHPPERSHKGIIVHLRPTGKWPGDIIARADKVVYD